MYEVRVSNGNNDVMFITEEEKMRVLRNRLETERKANRKLNQFIMMLRETAVQKCIAVILVVIALVATLIVETISCSGVPDSVPAISFEFITQGIFMFVTLPVIKDR